MTHGELGLSRSNDSYTYDHPRTRWPKWDHYTQTSPGWVNKQVFCKRPAKALLKREIHRAIDDPDNATFSPWNTLTDDFWCW